MDDFFEKFHDDISRYHDGLHGEFLRLAAEPTSKIPQIGDRVLIAAGLVGKGHLWIRLEAKILECADTSYYIEYTQYKYFNSKEPVREWVHQTLITDVLKKELEE